MFVILFEKQPLTCLVLYSWCFFTIRKSKADIILVAFSVCMHNQNSFSDNFQNLFYLVVLVHAGYWAHQASTLPQNYAFPFPGGGGQRGLRLSLSLIRRSHNICLLLSLLCVRLCQVGRYKYTLPFQALLKTWNRYCSIL